MLIYFAIGTHGMNAIIKYENNKAEKPKASGSCCECLANFQRLFLSRGGEK